MMRGRTRKCNVCGERTYGKLCVYHFKQGNKDRAFNDIRDKVTGPTRETKMRRWEQRLRDYFEVTNK
jgi:hypothetical protein